MYVLGKMCQFFLMIIRIEFYYMVDEGVDLRVLEGKHMCVKKIGRFMGGKN